MIYGGAAPNQHLAPLAEWALPRFGPTCYCIGSNYIWPWENNRTMRQIANDCGGRILRERYLAVGCTDVAEVIRDIAEMRPDFIFNTLIGESSYAFYRAYHALSRPMPTSPGAPAGGQLQPVGAGVARHRHPGRDRAHRLQRLFPVDRAARECGIHHGLPRARSGPIASLPRMPNPPGSSRACLLCRCAPPDRPSIPDVKRALYDCRLEAPQGPVWIDPENNHAWLTPRIGRSVAGAGFEMLWEAATPTRPDPYLANLSTERLRARVARPERARLRVVGS